MKEEPIAHLCFYFPNGEIHLDIIPTEEQTLLSLFTAAAEGLAHAYNELESQLCQPSTNINHPHTLN